MRGRTETIWRLWCGAGRVEGAHHRRRICARRCAGGMAGQGINMLVPTLLELGTDEQKEKYIKPTLSGEMVWCQGYSEPGAGSDLASLLRRRWLMAMISLLTAKRFGPRPRNLPI